jgi:NAD(P)-dependent dehydrogenase (short-subunit alcohol dehydrogenase family)
MDLTGKTAFITGGGGGIGGGIAEAFVEQGMLVVIADIDLARAQDEAAKYGGKAMALEIDVTSLHSWALARERALAHFGQVDVLCNNAGVSVEWKPLTEIAPETFDRAMKINVYGVFNGVKTFAHDMMARGYGHICNTSSLNGLISHGTMATYSASKFAVTAMTDALRDELAPHGVGVSALSGPYPQFHVVGGAARRRTQPRCRGGRGDEEHDDDGPGLAGSGGGQGDPGRHPAHNLPPWRQAQCRGLVWRNIGQLRRTGAAGVSGLSQAKGLRIVRRSSMTRPCCMSSL